MVSQAPFGDPAVAAWCAEVNAAVNSGGPEGSRTAWAPKRFLRP